MLTTVVRAIEQQFVTSKFSALNSLSFDVEQFRFIIALSLSIALLVFELIIFLLGTSLLRNKVTFASTLGSLFNQSKRSFFDLFSSLATLFHSAGAIALSFMVFTRWCSVSFWPIFAICSFIPFFIEVANAIGHNITN